MKKYFVFVLSVILLALFVQYFADAQGRSWRKSQPGRGQNCQFVDLNNDGICDNFVDADNDGRCDNCQGYGGGRMYGKGNYSQGMGLGLRQIISKPYPNPFSSTTSFEVNLPQSGNVEITLNDLEGKTMKTIFKGKLEKGTHQFQLDGQGLTPGRYLIVTKVDGKVYSSPVHYYK